MNDFRGKNLEEKIRLSGLFILFVFIVGCGTFNKSPNKTLELSKDSVYVTQIKTDTLFNSHQRINLLILDKKTLNKYTIDIGYNNVDLINTSQIAENNNAVAAINGSFFDVDNGGSVTYFEKNDSVICRTRPSDFEWAKPDSLINGAILLTKDHKLKIQSANTDQFYEKSKKEIFVMVSGPLLIRNSIPQKLPNMKFTNNRHPRTCLCTTKESIVFITIDGREEQAEGMSLIEVQKYLLGIGCIDAINLDGGGSTTMWTKTKGVVNKPSDKKGERSVANAILILKNH
jgi:exopolysaccharide biosynthesis protein